MLLILALNEVQLPKVLYYSVNERLFHTTEKHTSARSYEGGKLHSFACGTHDHFNNPFHQSCIAIPFTSIHSIRLPDTLRSPYNPLL